MAAASAAGLLLMHLLVFTPPRPATRPKLSPPVIEEHCGGVQLRVPAVASSMSSP